MLRRGECTARPPRRPDPSRRHHADGVEVRARPVQPQRVPLHRRALPRPRSSVAYAADHLSAKERAAKTQDPAVRAQAMRIMASATPPEHRRRWSPSPSTAARSRSPWAPRSSRRPACGPAHPHAVPPPRPAGRGRLPRVRRGGVGQRTLQAACAYPITAPVDDPAPTARRVRQARRDIVDLMLAEHCGDCQTCGRNGNCELPGPRRRVRRRRVPVRPPHGAHPALRHLPAPRSCAT